jgi:hypothetical protein
MNADIYVRQRKSLADRDALLAEMRKRAVSPPPTPPPPQACSGAEALQRMQKVNSTPPPANVMRTNSGVESWRSFTWRL